MRNLKKILALVLAMVMVLSMMVTASAVDFNDAAEIDSKHSVAVEVMAGLGILAGNPKADGTFDFNPKGTLTREQAAKILAYVMTNDLEYVELLAEQVTHPFTDVRAGHWAEDFIAYCYDAKLLSGMSATTFGLGRELTGYQLGKLLLCALGVGTAKDYEGAGWEVAVFKALKTAGLLAALDDVKFSAPITREHASQLVWNAMQYGVVVETTKYQVVGISDGFLSHDEEDEGALETVADGVATLHDTLATAIAAGVKVKTNGTTTAAIYNQDFVVETVVVETTEDSLYQDIFGGNVEKFVVQSNQATKFGQTYTEMVGGTKFAIETGLDLIGHEVIVYYAAPWTDKDHPGLTYAVVDNAKIVNVSAKKEGLTAKEVKSILGLKDAPTASRSVSKVDSYNITGSTTVYKLEANGTYTLNKGTYIVNSKVAAYAVTDYYDVERYTVVLDPKFEKNGCYTVIEGYIGAANPTVVVKVAEKAEDSFNLIKTDINWLSLVTKENPVPTVVYTVDRQGDFRILSEVESFNATISKVDFLSNGSPVIYVGDWYYLIDWKYDSDDDEWYGYYEYDAVEIARGVKHIGDLFEDPDFTTEYTFYTDATGKVFAYEPAEKAAEASDANLIVPVHFYHKTVKIPVDGDAYTDGGEIEHVTYWVQGVTLDGKEVNLLVDNNHAESALLFASALAGSDAETGINSDKEYTVTTAALNKLYTFYTDYNEEAEVTYAYFELAASDRDELAGIANVTDVATEVGTKKVTISGADYYLNDSFKIINITGKADKLNVNILDGNSALIQAGDTLIGKAATTAAYDSADFNLEYVIITRPLPIVSKDLIYVNAPSTSVTKVPCDIDKDGEIKSTEIAYQHVVYINGVATTILTRNANGVTGTGVALDAAGFYNYSVDPVNGLYTLATAAGQYVQKSGIANFNGMLTITGLADQDVDFSGATIVNLTGDKDVVTDASKLVGRYTISFVYNPYTKTTNLIYVVPSVDAALAPSDGYFAGTYKVTVDTEVKLIANDNEVKVNDLAELVEGATYGATLYFSTDDIAEDYLTLVYGDNDAVKVGKASTTAKVVDGNYLYVVSQGGVVKQYVIDTKAD